MIMVMTYLLTYLMITVINMITYNTIIAMMMTRLCEDTGNKEKLEQYMDQFADYKFSEHVFAW